MSGNLSPNARVIDEMGVGERTPHYGEGGNFYRLSTWT